MDIGYQEVGDALAADIGLEGMEKSGHRALCHRNYSLSNIDRPRWNHRSEKYQGKDAWR